MNKVEDLSVEKEIRENNRLANEFWVLPNGKQVINGKTMVTLRIPSPLYLRIYEKAQRNPGSRGRVRKSSKGEISVNQMLTQDLEYLYPEPVTFEANDSDPNGEEVARYNRWHQQCPACGKLPEITSMGCLYPSGTPAHKMRDTNGATCSCGWKGIVHDLVERY